MGKMSMSREDYLEAMVMLGATTEATVRSVDIASKLGVSRASVNKAVAELKKRGFVEQEHYGLITLTPEGLKLGQAVLSRHNLLTRFLTDVLGIDADIAEAEACQMEHAISDDSFRKWEAYIAKIGA